MLEALAFGLLGSCALVIGGYVGAVWEAPPRVSGVLLAFASGTLVSALAFELFPEAVALGGVVPAAVGLFLGSATFVAVNSWVDSRVGEGAGEPHDVPAPPSVAHDLAGAEAQQSEKIRESADNVGSAVAFGLLAAVTLDGVPENLALGVSLLSAHEGDAGMGGTLALLVAIFTSNFPEALVGAVAMRAAGRSLGFAVALWAAAALLLTAAVVLGYAALAGVSETTLSFALAFAGGAVLASLADTLMPEAFEHGRPLNAFATAAGFLLSFVLATQ